MEGALRFIQRQPRPLAARRTKDREVPELASVRGEAAAVEACRALSAKELRGKVVPVERCVNCGGGRRRVYGLMD